MAMEKAPAAAFRSAKLDALLAFAKIEPDAPVPDEIEFANEVRGFRLRIAIGDYRIESVVPWTTLLLASASQSRIIREEVRRTLHLLTKRVTGT